MSEQDDRPGWQRWDDRDDWFAEPEPERRSTTGEEVWLDDVSGEPPPRRRPVPRGIAGRRLALLGGGLVVALLLLLWAVGVFGGGGAAPPTAPATTTRPVTTTVRTPARVRVVPPSTTLSPGSSGVQVRRLQRALTRLGYPTGRVDGSYGPATVAALKRLQRANGLQPDGVLGPKTLRVLKARLAAT